MTVASLTVASPSPSGGAATVGRNIYAEGNRIVGKFRVTLKDLYGTGGVAFDPATNGFPRPVAEVVFSPHLAVANIALLRYTPSYDFVNKTITLFDQTDHDEPNGDDITGLVLDVTVYSD